MATGPTSDIHQVFDQLVLSSYAGDSKIAENKQQEIAAIVDHFTVLDPAKWQALSSSPSLGELRREIVAKVIERYGSQLEACLVYFNDVDKVQLFQSDPMYYRSLLEGEGASLCLINRHLPSEQILTLLSMIPQEERLAIKKLDLSKTRMTSLAPVLELFPNLNSCVANDCMNLKTLGFSQDLPSLNTLSLANDNLLEDLSSIEHLKNLQELKLNGCRLLAKTNHLQELPLTYLGLSYCNSLKSFDFLASIPSLHELDVSHLARFNTQALHYLRSVVQLQKVRLSQTPVTPQDVQSFQEKNIFIFDDKDENSGQSLLIKV